MMLHNQKTRIIFFIGSLKGGGKERRLIELLTYLNQKHSYELMVVVTGTEIDYSAFYKLNIHYEVIKKRWKKNDPTVFAKFYKICQQFKPHLIHTWGRMQSFYALPAVIGRRIPLVNGQITSAPPNAGKWSLKKIIDRINFSFSTVILSNSRAGIEAFKPPPAKAKVIYNGINPNRFENLPDPKQVRAKYGIVTPFTVIMVATFSNNKDYPLFFRIAERITRVRKDITFIAAGDNCDDDSVRDPFYKLAKQNPGILLTGRVSDVEALVNSCTLGVLFSNKAVHGEGISNSIVEYMGLGKPVVANDAGGTKEIVHHNVNGYLVTGQTENEIAELITDLIDNPDKCSAFGKVSRKIIDESFSLNKMGRAFEQTYQDILANENIIIYESAIREQRQQQRV
ncbi:glycosyltransferase family 4 protein [Longitalea luteola]|uniref:glycosyltransferase family 4 protein n=1 Tax=Longitalea luteola TaxID=2812563 RepID=UPI001F6129B4|nr:glycosyltransferase family 4 protein [Longitalea luteola]